MSVYDSARAALKELTDDTVLERVAVVVLRHRGYPGMRLTGPTGDLGRDGFDRPWFDDQDGCVLLASTEDRWTRKLKRDIAPYLAMIAAERPGKAVFVTTRSTRQQDQKRYKMLAAEGGITLEIVDLNELALELESDTLHHVAEYELGVRPRSPRALLSVAEHRETSDLPGANAPLVGRAADASELRALLSFAQGAPCSPVALIEGDAGVGKTRFAVDVSYGVATTVVASTGVALRREDLSDVPMSGPAVLLIDDAHRSPDLSGVAAMLRDPRYNGVRVVMTARRGFIEPIADRLGIEPRRVERLSLGVLDRQAIDTLVREHGIEHEPFRLHVIAAADGNPLVAHTACELARDTGSYTVADTGSILNGVVQRRLGFLDRPPDRARADLRRAVLVAVAVRGGVRGTDRAALCALTPAISALPPMPHEIDSSLSDLLEAGLIADIDDNRGEPSYTVRPDAAAPVIVSHALRGADRVGLRPAQALQILGRAAQFEPAADAGGRIGGLGLPTPPPNTLTGLALDVAGLATQLGVLTQAAHLSDDQQLASLLARAVQELLSADADTSSWADVLVLAGQVASISPEIVADLHTALIAQWPPAPGPAFFDDQPPDMHCRREIERLVRGVADQVGNLGQLPPGPLVAWLLDTVWLAFPAIGILGFDQVRHAISALSTTRRTTTAETDEQFLARRGAVLTAVGQWLETRHREEPANLGADERGLRPPEVVERIALNALAPLLSVLTSETTISLHDEDTYSWRHYVLPDHDDTPAALAEAVDLVISVLDQLTTSRSDRHAPREANRRDALTWIVNRPYELLGERARGVGLDNTPLPRHAADLLQGSADRLRSSIAQRWNQLPSQVRHVAAARAARAARPRGGRTRTSSSLAAAASSGDPIARAALDDPGLNSILTVFPVDVGLEVVDSASPDEQARQSAAAHLGSEVTLTDAIALLDEVGKPPPHVWRSYLDTFAAVVGTQASDPTPLLERLTQGRLLGDVPLLSAIVDNHADTVRAWLAAHLVDSVDIAEIALGLIDSFPPDDETAALDEIIARYFPAGPTDAEDDAPTVQGNLGSLARALAAHLAACRRNPTDRLRRLHSLGEATSVGSGELEWVLHGVKVTLTDPAHAAQILAADADLRAGLARVLTRASSINQDSSDSLAIARAEVVSILEQASLPDMAPSLDESHPPT